MEESPTFRKKKVKKSSSSTIRKMPYGKIILNNSSSVKSQQTKSKRTKGKKSNRVVTIENHDFGQATSILDTNFPFLKPELEKPTPQLLSSNDQEFLEKRRFVELLWESKQPGNSSERDSVRNEPTSLDSSAFINYIFQGYELYKNNRKSILSKNKTNAFDIQAKATWCRIRTEAIVSKIPSARTSKVKIAELKQQEDILLKQLEAIHDERNKLEQRPSHRDEEKTTTRSTSSTSREGSIIKPESTKTPQVAKSPVNANTKEIERNNEPVSTNPQIDGLVQTLSLYDFSLPNLGTNNSTDDAESRYRELRSQMEAAIQEEHMRRKRAATKIQRRYLKSREISAPQETPKHASVVNEQVASEEISRESIANPMRALEPVENNFIADEPIMESSDRCDGNNQNPPNMTDNQPILPAVINSTTNDALVNECMAGFEAYDHTMIKQSSTGRTSQSSWYGLDAGPSGDSDEHVAPSEKFNDGTSRASHNANYESSLYQLRKQGCQTVMNLDNLEGLVGKRINLLYANGMIQSLVVDQILNELRMLRCCDDEGCVIECNYEYCYYYPQDLYWEEDVISDYQDDGSTTGQRQNWESCEDVYGRKYYYNVDTKESQWDVPY